MTKYEIKKIRNKDFILHGIPVECVSAPVPSHKMFRLSRINNVLSQNSSIKLYNRLYSAADPKLSTEAESQLVSLVFQGSFNKFKARKVQTQLQNWCAKVCIRINYLHKEFDFSFSFQHKEITCT
jgi:hypothetical protein